MLSLLDRRRTRQDAIRKDQELTVCSRRGKDPVEKLIQALWVRVGKVAE